MHYVPPGHRSYVLEDSETVEFSPTRPYRDHMEAGRLGYPAGAGPKGQPGLGFRQLRRQVPAFDRRAAGELRFDGRLVQAEEVA